MIRSFLIYLVACLLFSPILYGQATMELSTSSSKLLEEAEKGIYASQFSKAHEVLEKVIQLDEGSYEVVLAYYQLANSSLWKALFEQSDQTLLEADKDVDRFIGEIRYIKDRKWRSFFLAEGNLQKATIAVQRNDYVGGAMALRTAYNQYSACLNEYPDFFDAYRGMGLLQMGIGSVPRKYRWAINILGYSGSIQEGLANMKLAIDKGTLNREPSLAYFAFIDIAMNQSQNEGIRYLQELVNDYPESPMMVTLFAFALLRNQRANDALEALLSIQTSVNDPSLFVPSTYYYYLGDTYFRLNNFEQAIDHYQKFLKTFEGRNLQATAYLNLGIAYEMIDDRENAVLSYKKVRHDSDFDNDERAVRLASFHMKQSMSETEKMLLKSQNAYDGGNYEQVLEILDSITTESISPVQKAEHAYRHGRTHEALENYDEAIEHYSFAVENPGDEFAKWAPWSQFYLGTCWEKLGKIEEAKVAYRKALAYQHNFDFHQGLEQRARVALSRLQKD